MIQLCETLVTPVQSPRILLRRRAALMMPTMLLRRSHSIWLAASAGLHLAATAARGQNDSLPADAPPVSAYTAWLGVVLLGLMWLLIAAIILGPLVRFFAPKPPAEPRNLPASY